MKTKILFALMLLGIILTTSFHSFSQSYQYPIIPGTDAWKKLKSHEEMIAACQLPNIVLEQMSSKQLLTTFLNYPLLFDLFAYNNPVDGFEKMTSRFNGFGALKERKDLAATVLNEYLKTEIGAVSSLKSDVERGLFTNTVSALELLIANNYVINQLTLSDSKILLTELLLKNKEKKAYKRFTECLEKLRLLMLPLKS